MTQKWNANSKKQVKKYKALLKDAQDELEHERETKSNASALRSLRTQLEDFEMREVAATKAQKRLQSEMDDLQAQFDEASRIKMEVGKLFSCELLSTCTCTLLNLLLVIMLNKIILMTNQCTSIF